MIIERQGSGQCQTDETLTYMGQKVALLAPSVACRYLGVWGTPTGDMSATKTRIFKKTEEARDLLKRHPLTPGKRSTSLRVLEWERSDTQRRWSRGRRRN